MERVYSYTMKYQGDEYDDGYREWLITPEGTVPFCAKNIEELCDAVVGRDIFSARDYVDAVNDGIMLGRMGYTSAEITEVEPAEKEEVF